jgi:acetoin utilization deacetylase AcuC-like enzyme
MDDAPFYYDSSNPEQPVAGSKKKVSYFFPQSVGEFHFGERHPMKPHRLTLTNHLVVGYELHKKMDVFQPRIASKEELQTFHDEDYVDFLSRFAPSFAWSGPSESFLCSG